MFNKNSSVEEIINLNGSVYLIKIYSPEIAKQIKPGQFLNVKVSDSLAPLLRRPFSVSNVEGDYLFLMVNLLGEGTKILTSKKKGDPLDILGPLGNGFNLDGDYELAVFAAGGIGEAPFPFVYKTIKGAKEIISFIGGKTAKEVVEYGIENPYISTDDGSLGFKGNVVQLMEQKKELLSSKKIKIFACGPTPMLKAVQGFAAKNNYECEISTESAMACGFGICQGCAIASAHQSEKYLLVCKDGPVFNAKDVVL
jgi:dihydroorotate dehydrogenase electron transfer subunit